MVEGLKVLFLSPEAVPFAKTGGLADVAGSLPEALKRQGADVRMVLPFYTLVRTGGFETNLIADDLDIPLGDEKLVVKVLETKTKEGVPVYLIEREDLYDRPLAYGDQRLGNLGCIRLEPGAFAAGENDCCQARFGSHGLNLSLAGCGSGGSPVR